jgi:hypothetical protein
VGHRFGGQIIFQEAISLSINSPANQELFQKLQRLFNAGNSHFLLMNWIIMDSLSF